MRWTMLTMLAVERDPLSLGMYQHNPDVGSLCLAPPARARRRGGAAQRADRPAGPQKSAIPPGTRPTPREPCVEAEQTMDPTGANLLFSLLSGLAEGGPPPGRGGGGEEDDSGPRDAVTCP